MAVAQEMMDAIRYATERGLVPALSELGPVGAAKIDQAAGQAVIATVVEAEAVQEVEDKE